MISFEKNLINLIMLVFIVFFLLADSGTVKAETLTDEKTQTTKAIDETSGLLGTCPWTFRDGILKIDSGTIDGVRFPDNWYYSNYQEIKEIDLIGPIVAQGACYALFAGFPNLTTIQGVQYLDTHNATNMYEMFANDSKLENLDLTTFDTSNVTNLTAMFAHDAALKVLDLSSFDTKQVYSMKAMFAGDEGLKSLDLSSFDMRKNVGTLNMLATGDYPPQELKLGANVILTSDMNLPDPEETDVYTGFWENVGEGNAEEPAGQYIYDSFDLLTLFQGQKIADTYVWQKKSTEYSLPSSSEKEISQSKENNFSSVLPKPQSFSKNNPQNIVSTTKQSSSQKATTSLQSQTQNYQMRKGEKNLLPRTGESDNDLMLSGSIIINCLLDLLVFKKIFLEI